MKVLTAVFLIAIVLVLGATNAHADLGDQLFKLLPDDGGIGHSFGYSVAISGTTAIVGAAGNDDYGTSSGSAYLFDITTGLQLFKLLPDDGQEGEGFGHSVAISGTTAIIGTPGDDDNGFASGSAYLFDINTGLQLFKLLPDDGDQLDQFGFFVAISGTTAIIGAPQDNDNGNAAGSAYLYDITTGLQLFKLLPDDGDQIDLFGYSVAISGTTAIVGAWRDEDNGSNSGSAYLFDITTGLQLFKLLPDDGAVNDEFGWSVAISGTTAIVGAWRDDDDGFDTGSAYLFDITTGLQLFKFLPDDGAEGDWFGISVAISGTTAIVGARRHDDNGVDTGSAYLFDITTGEQLIKLLADDGEIYDYFGTSVAISGTTAIVGALWDDDNGGESGSAYIFNAAKSSPCPWDLDGNRLIGTSDLLTLLASWGPCKGCPADFDGNGAVGTSDLLALLANWGLCP